MNSLPLFNMTTKPADEPIEAGVQLYRPLLTEVYNDRQGFLIVIQKAKTMDTVINGKRVVCYETGTIEPDDGQWYLNEWEAELRGAELLIKRKELMMDHITKQMDRAEKARSEVTV